MNVDQLAAFVREHDIRATVDSDGTLWAEETSVTRDGSVTREWIALPPRMRDVRAWVGY